MNLGETLTTRSVEARQVIDALPDEVFDAWVIADLIEAWWGPEGFETIVHELDLKVGGRFVFEMTAADGTVSTTAGFFREIMRPDRLVLEFTEHCNSYLPDGVEPQLARSVVTVDFLARDTRTEVVVTHAELHSAYAKLATFGWSGALRKLVSAADRRNGVIHQDVRVNTPV